MDDLAASAVWGLLIGATLVGGALVAIATRLPERVAATVAAFGGGVLLAAVALELVPEADAQVGASGTALGLVAGMLIYVGADTWLTRDEVTKAARRSGHAAAAGRSMSLHPDHSQSARGESIAAGMVIDGVPESIALGLTIAEGRLSTALLAGIIIGNAVEAYGAAQPIIAGGHSARFAIVLMAGIGLSLFLATVLGATMLSGASSSVIGTTQAVAAGAVLAVIVVSIVPYAFDEVNSIVACAAVGGFVCGYLLS
jgi:ZIP family zinc transporter